jgi:hypothetical protein
MSDHPREPEDLFDAICRLDDLAEWLQTAGYWDEAQQVRAAADALKAYVSLRIVDPVSRP